MQNTVIEEATVASLPALNRLFTEAVNAHFSYFPAGVRRRVIQEHSVRHLFQAVLDGRRAIVIARRGNNLIGYCLGAAPHRGPAQIYWLYVEPNYRGSGTGRHLLEKNLDILKKKGARNISIATHDHRGFYERQGFVFVKKTEVDSVDMDILTYEVTP